MGNAVTEKEIRNRETTVFIWFCSLKGFGLPVHGLNKSLTVGISPFVGRLGKRSGEGTL